MGFSDGTAAFEARQAAVRKKAAEGTERPPLTEFELKLAEARREAQNEAAQNARQESEQARWEDHVLEAMATMSAEFSRQADAIGFRPLTVVTARSEVVRTLVLNRSKTLCRVGEVIGEGWLVTDLDDRSEYGSLRNQFIVMREGRWIVTIPNGNGTAGGELRGLPRGVQADEIYALNTQREGIAYMRSLGWDSSKIQKLLAKEILWMERVIAAKSE